MEGIQFVGYVIHNTYMYVRGMLNQQKHNNNPPAVKGHRRRIIVMLLDLKVLNLIMTGDFLTGQIETVGDEEEASISSQVDRGLIRDCFV